MAHLLLVGVTGREEIAAAADSTAFRFLPVVAPVAPRAPAQLGDDAVAAAEIEGSPRRAPAALFECSAAYTATAALLRHVVGCDRGVPFASPPHQGASHALEERKRGGAQEQQEEEEAEMAAGDAATPLLETAYHEGCPACAVDRSKALNPGIPYMRFFHIWIIILVSCLPISSLFPFLYFMIRDLHVAKRVEDIGFYAGFVGASYMLGRALTSTAWGMIADRIGRKPAYAVEVCRPEHQSIGLSLVSTSWAIGLIVGPAIGGYLAQETLHKHAIERKGDCKTGSLSTHLVDSQEFAEQQTSPDKDKSLFKNWPLMSSIVLFCIVSFDDMAYTEIFSLWSESDKEFGGLNFSSEDVGQVLAITAPASKSNRKWLSHHFNVLLQGICSSRSWHCVRFRGHKNANMRFSFQAAPLLEKKGSTGGVGDGYCIEGCPGCGVDRRKAASSGIPYGSFLFVWIVTLCTESPSSESPSIKFGGPHESQEKPIKRYPYVRVASNRLIHLLSSHCPCPAGGEGMEEEVPLLKLKGDYHQGCPGCAYDRKKEVYRGLPYKEFLYLWMICLTAALPISSLFPFLYFMIRDLHVAKRTEDIGFYAGFVGASFMFGRCLTSTVWGIAADRIGRKPVVVFGIFAVVIFNTLFGLSFTYWMAIATRFLLGALNGLLGPIKAYAIEVCRPEHEALALSLVSTAWGIGLIIGPAIGGYLSQPAEKFPNVFSPDSLFARFPYFLPCLCISVFAAVVLIGCIWMPETLHKHKADAKRYQTVEALESHLIDPKEKADQNGSLDCKKSLLSNWPLMSSIILYCVFSFHDMAYTEIFSLWAESDRKYGGLSLSSEDVGQVLAITGASLLVYQLFIYPRINKVIGHIKASRIAAILCIPILFAYPYMTYLSGPGLTIILNIASVIKNNLGVTIITGCFILQNNAVPQDQRGAANGLAMTGMSFFKAVAPAGAGIVFSWAQKRQHASFLPGDQMVFFLLNVFELLGLILTFKPFLAVPDQHDTN
uniref:Major facilitator superfamily (MFS) profile domain-containing protein n=1 Tax=Oryza punctata TaxID=4537 RepID=A0A0E0MC63_ORYPU